MDDEDDRSPNPSPKCALQNTTTTAPLPHFPLYRRHAPPVAALCLLVPSSAECAAQSLTVPSRIALTSGWPLFGRSSTTRCDVNPEQPPAYLDIMTCITSSRRVVHYACDAILDAAPRTPSTLGCSEPQQPSIAPLHRLQHREAVSP
jgi:hypothetical protein